MAVAAGTDKRQRRGAYCASCLEGYGIRPRTMRRACNCCSGAAAAAAAVAARAVNVIELMTARRASANFDGLRMRVTKKLRLLLPAGWHCNRRQHTIKPRNAKCMKFSKWTVGGVNHGLSGLWTVERGQFEHCFLWPSLR